MWHRSITFRLALYFALASTSVLLVIGYSVGRSVESHFVEMDTMELHGKLELVRHVLAKVRLPEEIQSLPERMDDALTGHEGLFVNISKPDGATIFATPNAFFPEALLRGAASMGLSGYPETLSWKRDGHGYRGFATDASTEASELPLAVVAIAISTDQHHRFMALFYRSLWVAIAMGILSTGVLGWLAATRGLGPVREMAAVARNITVSRLSERLQTDASPVELRDLATAFNGMLSRLEDSFRRLSEFSSDLAHELRTPIANMMTQTQVALSRTRTADEYREVLYSNAEEFDRLARMISDMLFLAKADHGLIVPQSAPIELATEVQDLFEFYDALADDQGIKLALAGQGEVSGDRLMIRRAISNLLSNAINHTPRGGQVNVRIVSADNGVVRLLVENPSEGIAPEHLLRIFDRFYRVDPSRQRSTDGAGLGLAIAKSIVTAHKGTVQAFSADGVTRFEIRLPLRTPA